MIILSISACTPPANATPMPLPATEPAGSVVTQTPGVVSPTVVDQSANWKQSTNSPFGFGFQFPSDWFGPDQYVSDQTLRVSVGSDIVYPYRTDRTEQVYEIKNSFYVVIQYSKNDQNQYWKDAYQSLVDLQDGEPLSDQRSQVIRVRQLNLGRFEGIEYISTLSETAQTEPVYSRQVILFDGQSNVLTMMGTSNNVEISDEKGWRAAYQSIDEMRPYTWTGLARCHPQVIRPNHQGQQCLPPDQFCKCNREHPTDYPDNPCQPSVNLDCSRLFFCFHWTPHSIISILL